MYDLELIKQQLFNNDRKFQLNEIQELITPICNGTYKVDTKDRRHNEIFYEIIPVVTFLQTLEIENLSLQIMGKSSKFDFQLYGYRDQPQKIEMVWAIGSEGGHMEYKRMEHAQKYGQLLALGE